ncbi:MAG: hypothetical protein JRJ65_13335 [Deltaproteobacteria bacterium]|nr:hypothetical protein [Deltaproteobacteria bacterium]
MEKYRLVIFPGTSEGLATTPRSSNLPAKVVETKESFEVYFENKRIIIDRFTATFQVWMQGAKTYIGSGSCVRLQERQF